MVVNVGDVVEDFELQDESGTCRRLGNLAANGPVVLFFFPAAFSPQCRMEACRFRDVMDEFLKVGALPVGVSVDSLDRQRSFSKRFSLGYPLLSDADGAVSRRFGVLTGLPITWVRSRRNTYIIGPDLRVMDVIRSEFRMSVHADLALEYLRNSSVPTQRPGDAQMIEPAIAPRGVLYRQDAAGDEPPSSDFPAFSILPPRSDAPLELDGLMRDRPTGPVTAQVDRSVVDEWRTSGG